MTIEERLDRVELEMHLVKRRNRYFALAASLVVLCSVSLGVTAHAKEKAIEVVRATRFEILDEKGNMRGVWGVSKDGPVLILKNDAGKVGAALSDDSLTLGDERGELRVSLDVSQNGPHLHLFDANHIFRVILAVPNGGPRLGLYDDTGKPRVVLGVEETETQTGKTITFPESSLLFYGPDGKVIWNAP